MPGDNPPFPYKDPAVPFSGTVKLEHSNASVEPPARITGLGTIRIPIFVGIWIRLAIISFYPTLRDALAERVEVATPLSSIKRMQEGVHLYTHGINPYDGNNW